MKGKQAPVIHVGILLADKIGFSMEGSFVSDQGGAPYTGEARAVVEEGQIEVLQEGQPVARGRELLFSPVDESRLQVRNPGCGDWDRFSLGTERGPAFPGSAETATF